MSAHRWQDAVVVGLVVMITLVIPAVPGLFFTRNYCPDVIHEYIQYSVAIANEVGKQPVACSKVTTEGFTGSCWHINNYGCKVANTTKACNFRCIHIALVCDGTPDCPLGDDEDNCPTTATTPTTTSTTSSASTSRPSTSTDSTTSHPTTSTTNSTSTLSTSTTAGFTGLPPPS